MKNAAFVLSLPTRRSSSSVVSFDKSKRPLAGLRGLLGDDDEYLQRALTLVQERRRCGRSMERVLQFKRYVSTLHP